MDVFYILNVQTILTLITFGLIAKWYLSPKLNQLPWQDALTILCWIHVLRYTPLTLLVPGQVESSVPIEVAEAIAYGDLLSGLLALISVIFLKYRLPGALLIVWVFNLVGIVDVINALRVGVGAELFRYSLGFNWYILTYYVPILIITHVMMVYRLIKRKNA